MAEYKNVENIRDLFDEEFKKTRQLIQQGETHLDNLAEGFLEADRVLLRIPTSDVVEVVRKPVADYEGYYEVDQFGRIYSLDRTISVSDNGRLYDKPLKSKQMKQSMHTKGYKTVSLTKEGKTKTCYVHRIVAEAFINNPDNLPFVNHKDEDKTNNFVDNLEWCTNEYNIKYGTARKRQAKVLTGKKHTKEHNEKISKGVKAYYCSYGERKCEE